MLFHVYFDVHRLLLLALLLDRLVADALELEAATGALVRHVSIVWWMRRKLSKEIQFDQHAQQNSSVVYIFCIMPIYI